MNDNGDSMVIQDEPACAINKGFRGLVLMPEARKSFEEHLRTMYWLSLRIGMKVMPGSTPW